MYSLDVNFLNDRPEYKSDARPSVKQSKASTSKVPIVAGVAVGLLLPALAGGLWFVLQQQTADLQKQGQELDATLAKQKAQQDEIAKINAQTQQISADTQQLASVFNQIKPWSAILQTLGDIVPPNVQIKSIQQTEVPATAVTPSAPAPAGTPNPTPAAPAPSNAIKLDITGTARSFNDVNDFLLTLQKSRFFNKDQTLLLSANLVNNSTQTELTNTQNKSIGSVTVELPKVIEYRISTVLSDVPASELIRELEGKGAVGLVTRLKTLQQKGVIR